MIESDKSILPALIIQTTQKRSAELERWKKMSDEFGIKWEQQ